MNAKQIIVMASLVLTGLHAYAKPGGPELTAEQKECLQSKIGEPGSGDRPSRKAMRSALQACGVEAPAHGRRGGQGGPPGGRMELSDEQRACLDGEIGEPGSGERPSREAMEAAFSKCGIEKPARSHSKNGAARNEDESVAELDQLTADFRSAESAEAREEARESIAGLFQSTQDEAVRARIRAFLKANPPSRVKTSSGSRTAAVLK